MEDVIIMTFCSWLQDNATAQARYGRDSVEVEGRHEAIRRRLEGQKLVIGARLQERTKNFVASTKHDKGKKARATYHWRLDYRVRRASSGVEVSCVVDRQDLGLSLE